MDNEPGLKESIGKLPKTFVTEKGSVYTYGPDGRAERYKKITGEKFGKMGITVFFDADPDNKKRIVDAYERGSGKFSIHLVEIYDGKPVEIIDLKQVVNAENLRFCVMNLEKRKLAFSTKASLTPKVGSVVYEQAPPRRDGDKSWSHLGHEVVKID